MIALYITLGVVVLLIIMAIGIYNRLVALREQVRTSWAQIDVMLKRRYDLIPNLVETVKGYASHEKDTLERVISARNRAVAAGDNMKERGEAEAQLSSGLRQIFALSEAYPDLKANQNFLQLQGELTSTENQVASKRGGYNNTVQTYNTTVMTFPNNLFAGMFGFTPQPLFEVTDSTQREAPKVKF